MQLPSGILVVETEAEDRIAWPSALRQVENALGSFSAGPMLFG
jgi:hypothetical protein